MNLDLSSLSTVIGQLEKGLALLDSDLAASDADVKEQFETALVQQFEFVYELSTKMVRRRLELDAINPVEVRHASFMGLMRRAADAGLQVDPEAWFDYRDLRNRTSHTYDHAQARAVVQELPAFLAAAKRVFEALEAN